MRTSTTLVLLATLVACNDEMIPVATDHDGSNAVAAFEDATGHRLETFEFGGSARSEVVDVLFVLDNSSSMRAVRTRVQAGFLALSADSFPAESRVAVMSTLPADPSDFTRPHPAVSRKRDARADPGFLKLVSDKSIANFIEVRPNRAHRFPLTGCSEWFAPGATNVSGAPCLLAHTQSSDGSYGAEAGLTALAQLLQSRDGKRTFRPGAAVNIIFVSDTHDPGVGSKRPEATLLEQMRPEARPLVDLLLKDNPVSSVRFHAIAPASECVEPWLPFGPVYTEAAEATGGVALDMCEAESYRPIFESVLDIGTRPTRPVFALGTTAEEVDEVVVDGVPVPWTLDEAKQVLTVEVPEIPTRTSSVDVRYRRLGR